MDHTVGMADHSERLSLVVQAGPRTVITAVGELDPATAPQLDRAIADARADGATELVIDLAGVTFVDSSGLRSLIAAHKLTQPQPLVVRRPSAFAAQLFEITGLDDQFVIEPEGVPHDD